MKILLASNRNPHFHNTNFFIEKGLRDLGHDVSFFEVRDYRIPGRLRALVPLLQAKDLGRINQNLIEAVRTKSPDLCLVVGGVEVLPETVKQIRAVTPVVLWTTDAPFKQYFRNILLSSPHYTRTFCQDSAAVDILAAAGHPSEWLPFACDEQLHAPVVLSPADRLRYLRDVSFVGSWYPSRERTLSVLAEKFDGEIGVWGPSWSKARSSRLLSLADDRRVDYVEWAKIYSAASIVLAVHFHDARTPCHQASPKLFEALACGAFVLCDQQKDARKIFEDGKHLVFFRDEDDLVEKARYYLGHPEERERIRTAGRDEVLSRHTWPVRLKALIEDVKKGTAASFSSSGPFRREK